MSEAGSSAYDALEARFKRLSALREATGVLNWDTSTMMPPGGAEARSEQLATLEVVCHELLNAPDLGELIARAEEESGTLEPWARANLREMRRHWRHETALEPALVEALSRAVLVLTVLQARTAPAAITSSDPTAVNRRRRAVIRRRSPRRLRRHRPAGRPPSCSSSVSRASRSTRS